MDKREIAKFLQDLVRIPTVNPPADTRECAHFLVRKFKEDHIEAEIIEGREGACNVIARLGGGKGGKVLLLNGHLDVVPPGEDWSVDPFGGETRDGKIFGRGTCDMKSGIASMACTMIDLKRSGVRLDGEIMFMAVADEETGSEFGTLHLLKNQIGTDADFAIVSEPTTLKVVLGNRGLRWLDLSLKGRASHAGRPHLGVNAISYAAKIVEAIQSHKFHQRDDFFEIPTPSVSVTMINGGTKVNIIPERCDLSLDRRMIPGETGEQVIEELRKIIDPILTEEETLQLDMKVRPIGWDPYVISEDEPIARATMESVKEILGAQPMTRGKAACTDASHLFHLGSIPTVLFGPGNENLSHKPDECVEIDNLAAATEVYRFVCEKLLC